VVIETQKWQFFAPRLRAFRPCAERAVAANGEYLAEIIVWMYLQQEKILKDLEIYKFRKIMSD
jgi:hypothetical protein